METQDLISFLEKEGVPTLKGGHTPCNIVSELHGVLLNTQNFKDRWAIASYVQRCEVAGFCSTGDQIRACAERYIAGKRKVTPPGTAKKKRELKERQALRASVPVELAEAIKTVVNSNVKAVTQYKSGNIKAVNAMIGQVMRIYKTDAQLIQELLVQEITEI